MWSMSNSWFLSNRERSDIGCWIVQFRSVFFFMSCLWGENDRSWKNDDCVFGKQGRMMFFVPGRVAYFTDEVARSRVEMFQLWRKLLAFAFGFIKKKHPVYLNDLTSRFLILQQVSYLEYIWTTHLWMFTFRFYTVLTNKKNEEK
jgi:hypothetical protein